jgi:hypothetical protein
MSLAEFNFANIDPSSSARHDWKSQVRLLQVDSYSQVDQIGRIFACWAVVYFGQFF